MKKFKNRIKEKIALLRLQQGDTEAFGFLYDEYVEQIYRYVFFRVSDTDIAQDITQEVFLQTWEYISNSKGTVQHLQSFLYKVAYNKVVDHYRFKERQASLISTIADETEIAGSAPDKSELDVHFLLQRVKELKQEYQDVIVLRHVESLNIGEIAEIIGKDQNNVRVTLHRAMTALRNLVNKNDSN